MNKIEISNEEWQLMRDKILTALDSVETTNQREEVIKLAVLIYIYKSTETEKTFNDNCEILDAFSYEDTKSKKFGR